MLKLSYLLSSSAIFAPAIIFIMNETTIYLLLYFTNLAFIVTNVYGWIMKEFHTANPYREHFDTLFPAQRFVGLLYLGQLMEIPYLLMMGQAKALFYINAFSMLFFAAMMVVIGEGYFFWRRYKTKELFLHFLPISIPVGWLLLAAWGVVPATPALYRWMFWIVCLLFLYYIIRVVMVQQKILCKVNHVVKGNDTSDYGFPLPLSLKTRWLLLPIPLLMFGCFLCNDVYVKMVRDILFTIVNVWFLLYTIKPHRKVLQDAAIGVTVTERISESELPMIDEPRQNDIQEAVAPIIPPKNAPKHKLSSERCRELEQLIIDRLESEKLFLNPVLTIESLAGLLNSNKSYVSEAINRGNFGSYYALINHYRVEHAIQMFRENPQMKIEEVSKVSGFSSKSVFSQVFKRSKGVSATQFIQEISSKTEIE